MITEVEHIKWKKHAGLWAFAICLVILTFTGVLARITLSLQSASVQDPELSLIRLLKDDTVTNIDLLRDEEARKHYLVETIHGTKLIILEKDPHWTIVKEERLR